jgi:aquaporin Z
MGSALKQHWPEYLMEAAGLGLFMFSACCFGALLEHPASAAHQALPWVFGRRVLMGLAMGATAVGLIYSPWGKQSGAHLNPAVTLTFWRLGRINRADAGWYVLAQFGGSVLGVLFAAALLKDHLSHPAVNYVATLPGHAGVTIAFLAEVVMTFIQMTVVLQVSSRSNWARYTGVCAATLVALYISLEAPLSGMSLNPARTFGSALVGQIWRAWWLYFTAPPVGMLAAAEFFERRRGRQPAACAKLHHQNNKRCIFCGQPAQPAHSASPASPISKLSRVKATL